MGAAAVVAGIGFGAAAFMLRVLIALLRERSPSVCYWVVPVRRGPEKGKDREALRRIYVDKSCCATAEGSVPYRELEKENHDKGNYREGLIVLDVRNVYGKLGGRAIHTRRSELLGKRRTYF
jgi:hypothetical protein